MCAEGIPGLTEPAVTHDLQALLDCAGSKTAAAIVPLALLDASALARW